MMGTCLTPAVEIKLIGTDGSIKPSTFGIVDSGCDLSTFPVEWAQILGIELDDCQLSSGMTAGGTTKVWHYADGVAAILGGRKIRLNANFNEGLPFILLGREDFFDLYRASFDQRRKQFTLEAYED